MVSYEKEFRETAERIIHFATDVLNISEAAIIVAARETVLHQSDLRKDSDREPCWECRLILPVVLKLLTQKEV
jgi:hypothetical protein